MLNKIISRIVNTLLLASVLSLLLISCAQPIQKEGVWYTHDGKPYTPTLATDYVPPELFEEDTWFIDTAMDLDGRMHIVGSFLNDYSVWGYFEGNTIKGAFGETDDFNDLSNLRTPVEMYDPLIEIDDLNRPHILFINNDRLCHCYIKGREWYSTDGEPINDESDASKCSVTNLESFIEGINHDYALDSLNNPHITFIFKLEEIAYVAYIHWDGSDWVGFDSTVIDQNSDDWLSGDELYEYARVSEHDKIYKNRIQVSCPKLEIDSNDHPHIVWLQYFDPETDTVGIVYRYWENDRWNSIQNEDGSPYVVTVNPYEAGKYIYYIDLKLDNNDTPHIIYDDNSLGLTGARYLTLKSDTWEGIYGKTNPDNLLFEFEKLYKHSTLCFELDNKNYPHFMWCSERSDTDSFFIYDVYYYRFNGEYPLTLYGTLYRLSSDKHPISTNVTQSLNVKEASISLDKDGNPHIIIMTTDGLKYLHGKPADRWEKTWEEMEQENLKE